MHDPFGRPLDTGPVTVITVEQARRFALYRDAIDRALERLFPSRPVSRWNVTHIPGSPISRPPDQRRSYP
jgi:hypothetical protein